MSELNFKGIKTVSGDVLYDIIDGYEYAGEIEDEYTREKLKEAIDVIQAMRNYMDDMGLLY